MIYSTEHGAEDVSTSKPMLLSHTSKMGCGIRLNTCMKLLKSRLERAQFHSRKANTCCGKTIGSCAQPSFSSGRFCQNSQSTKTSKISSLSVLGSRLICGQLPIIARHWTNSSKVSWTPRLQDEHSS